jgi:hypothetical protein
MTDAERVGAVRDLTTESDEDLLLSLETYTLNAAEYPGLVPVVAAVRAEVLRRLREARELRGRLVVKHYESAIVKRDDA